MIFEQAFHRFLRKKEKIQTTEVSNEQDINMEDPFNYVINDDSQSANSANQKASIRSTRRLLANEIEAREAVDDIRNDALVEEDEHKIFEPAFINPKLVSPELQRAINMSWDELYSIMKIHKNATTYWNSWYEDGILPFETIYNKNRLEDGIIKTKWLDPLTGVIRKEKDSDNYHWYYDGTRDSSLPPEQFSVSFSGIKDETKSFYVSYLSYAVRPINQLNSILQSVVLYAISASRMMDIYYVKTPAKNNAKKNEQFVREFAKKNKATHYYNKKTGQIINQKDNISLSRDLFIGVGMNGEKNLEIDRMVADRFTISDLPIVDWFLNRAYRALMVDRIKNSKDTATISFDTGSSDQKEETRYFRAIISYRRWFSGAFLDILKKHMVAKTLINNEEWENLSENIYMKFHNGSNYYEQEKLNNIKMKFELVEMIASYLAKDSTGDVVLFPKDFVYKNIFGITDEDIKEYNDKIKSDRTDIKKNEPDPPIDEN